MTDKIYKPIAPFKDHSNCSGHRNFMLDSTLETEQDRNAVLRAVENAMSPELKAEIKKEEDAKAKSVVTN